MQRNLLTLTYGLLTSILFGLPLVSCAADAYPVKPIRMLVPFPAAGISNGLARVIGHSLDNTLGQRIVVDNRPGAGTTIASDIVAKSAPDGHTLFMQDMTTHAINASLYHSLPYDPIKSFTPITLVASTALVFLTHPSLPATTVKSLIAFAKTRPGQINYGSSGVGTILHLSGEMFNKQAGTKLVHVAYKSGSLASLGILGGEVQVAFGTMPPPVGEIKTGKLLALAVTTRDRVAILPEVPTMAEAGLPDFEIVLYSGVLGPSGLPKGVVKRLNSEIIKAVKSPEVMKFYHTISANEVTSTPEEFSAFLASQINKYRKVVLDVGARAN